MPDLDSRIPVLDLPKPIYQVNDDILFALTMQVIYSDTRTELDYWGAGLTDHDPCLIGLNAEAAACFGGHRSDVAPVHLRFYVAAENIYLRIQDTLSDPQTRPLRNRLHLLADVTKVVERAFYDAGVHTLYIVPIDLQVLEPAPDEVDRGQEAGGAERAPRTSG